MIGERKEDHDSKRSCPSGLGFAESLRQCPVKTGSHRPKNEFCFHGGKSSGEARSDVGRKKQTGTYCRTEQRRLPIPTMEKIFCRLPEQEQKCLTDGIAVRCGTAANGTRAWRRACRWRGGQHESV